MKPIVVFIFLFIVAQSFSQNNVFKGRLITEKNYYAELEFEFISEKIIVPIIIENKTYRFLLDTGAPNLISAKLKSVITTTSIKKINITDANNRRSSMEIVSIPEIMFGGVSFKNCPTLVDANEENLIFDCFGVDGIIGSNMLQKSIVQIDLKENMIRLTDKRSKLNLNKKDATRLYLVGNQKSPYIWINLKGNNNARERLLIDTGMKGFYDLSKRNFNVLQKDKIFKVHHAGTGSKSIGFFGAAEKNKHYRISIDTLKINGCVFTDVITETTNDNNSRIGAEVLKYGIMTIDYLNKKFYYSPFKAINDLQKKLLGFSPTIINNKLVVGVVWDKNLQKEIGYGDEIIKLNTMLVDKIPICDFITSNIFNLKETDSIELTVKTKDSVLKTVLAEKKFLN